MSRDGRSCTAEPREVGIDEKGADAGVFWVKNEERKIEISEGLFCKQKERA